MGEDKKVQTEGEEEGKLDETKGRKARGKIRGKKLRSWLGVVVEEAEEGREEEGI